MSEVSFSVNAFIREEFEKNALPSLMDFVRIPNLSKSFDAQWNTNGLLEKAAEHLANWAKAQNLNKTKVELIQEKNRTPLVFVEVEGDCDKTVLFYGHFDKQPHFDGWREGLGPTNPVIKDGKLFGRGAVDDGYSIYTSVLAIKAAQLHGAKLPRCVIFIEGDEESEDEDLPFYFERLADRIGDVQMVVCLDSSCLDYEHFCLTNSLRGCLECKVSVQVLQQGLHSGGASGTIPSSFRILRQLLDRLECSKTGTILDTRLSCPIPPSSLSSLPALLPYLSKTLSILPLIPNLKTSSPDLFECYLNRVWRPQLSYVGIDGMPSTEKGGNVLRPYTAIKLSLRLPPLVSAKTAEGILKEIFEKDVPYGAEVKVYDSIPCDGWYGKEPQEEIKLMVEKAGQKWFENKTIWYGEGGTIPFINVLGEKYPNAYYLVTGIQGYDSNAHGPNECLDIEAAIKITCTISTILSEIVALI